MNSDGERERRAASGREFLDRLQLGRPVIADGVLPGGQHWTLAYGVNDAVPVADVFVEFAAGGGLAISVGRYPAADGTIQGASSGARSNDRRVLCWMTDAETAQVALDTVEHDELFAALVHSDAGQRVRVFLTVVEDRAVALHTALFRDQQRRTVGVEDLSNEQADFESWVADPRAYLAARGIAAGGPGGSAGGQPETGEGARE